MSDHPSVRFSLVSRNLIRRLWPILLLLPAGLLWLSASDYTPRQYRVDVPFLKQTRPAGAVKRPPPFYAPQRGDVWAERALQVRRAFMHGFQNYRRYAMPMDELKPTEREGVNNFHGWGVTMYDSLDTMWLMGLEKMFYETVAEIADQQFDTLPKDYAHFFEVVIRYLGGLLSAYALSEDPRLLTLADRLGTKLLPAFDSPSGLPYWGVDTVVGEPRRTQRSTCMAEAFSNQMEFKYLAHVTGNPQYYMATERPMKVLYDERNVVLGGLYSTVWSLATGKPNGTSVAIGGCADSAYEYFLKQWLMTGQKDPRMRDLYVRSANAIIDNMLYIDANRPILYASDLRNGRPRNHFEHLTCFLPALLALGVSVPALGLTPNEKEMHGWAAEGLGNTCWTMYDDMSSGLSPDAIALDQWTVEERGLWIARVEQWEKEGRNGLPPAVAKADRQRVPGRRGYVIDKDAYLLRPETVETFYLLWRTTGEEKWRERGWAVFEAIEKHSRAEYGYSSVRYIDEQNHSPLKSDDQPSWFFAETLKYLFLLFMDEDLVPLDKWVFNTEAHPFPVFEWSEQERKEFGIDL
ncbi:alpha-1,2-Mannosidase [Mycena chlorophos]|uniref:alpha-1,2-Mannosidase n=1 Tax=Mycena chlorophos TaxID=658473 RepID=A0A8H6TIT6_MYCCL|nr:alpha-1,2-Mannosidase [Mycena chlorophos]